MAAKKQQSFMVTGNIKGEHKGFHVNVIANSAKHAAAVATTWLGSKHGLRATAIEITEVKKEP